MEENVKLKLNKIIRNYDGDLDFMLSLKKQLKNKYCKKEEIGGKTHKVLSDKQYVAAISILSLDINTL